MDTNQQGSQKTSGTDPQKYRPVVPVNSKAILYSSLELGMPP